jgi:hypothetical protein
VPQLPLPLSSAGPSLSQLRSTHPTEVTPARVPASPTAHSFPSRPITLLGTTIRPLCFTSAPLLAPAPATSSNQPVASTNRSTSRWLSGASR